MYTIIAKYKMWQEVYIRHDNNQIPRMITFIGQEGNNIVYGLSGFGNQVQQHMQEEVSDECNYELKNRSKSEL